MRVPLIELSRARSVLPRLSRYSPAMPPPWAMAARSFRVGSIMPRLRWQRSWQSLSRTGGSFGRGRDCRAKRASNQPKPRGLATADGAEASDGSNLVADDLGVTAARAHARSPRVAAACLVAERLARRWQAPAAGLRAAPPGGRLLAGRSRCARSRPTRYGGRGRSGSRRAGDGGLPGFSWRS